MRPAREQGPARRSRRAVDGRGGWHSPPPSPPCSYSGSNCISTGCCHDPAHFACMKARNKPRRRADGRARGARTPMTGYAPAGAQRRRRAAMTGRTTRSAGADRRRCRRTLRARSARRCFESRRADAGRLLPQAPQSRPCLPRVANCADNAEWLCPSSWIEEKNVVVEVPDARSRRRRRRPRRRGGPGCRRPCRRPAVRAVPGGEVHASRCCRGSAFGCFARDDFAKCMRTCDPATDPSLDGWLCAKLSSEARSRAARATSRCTGRRRARWAASSSGGGSARATTARSTASASTATRTSRASSRAAARRTCRACGSLTCLACGEATPSTAAAPSSTARSSWGRRGSAPTNLQLGVHRRHRHVRDARRRRIRPRTWWRNRTGRRIPCSTLTPSTGGAPCVMWRHGRRQRPAPSRCACSRRRKMSGRRPRGVEFETFEDDGAQYDDDDDDDDDDDVPEPDLPELDFTPVPKRTVAPRDVVRVRGGVT